MVSGRRWLHAQTSTTRAALLVIVPLLLAMVGSVIVLSQAYQLIVLRVVFLIVVCLLPATMWYLYIATRKASLHPRQAGAQCVNSARWDLCGGPPAGRSLPRTSSRVGSVDPSRLRRTVPTPVPRTRIGEQLQQ